MFKWIRRIVLSSLVAYLLLWALTIFIHYPNPIAAIQLGLAEPSESGKLMPAEKIPATAGKQWVDKNISAEPFTVYVNNRATSIDDFLKKTHTTAFIVVKDNQLIYEKYFNGADAKSLLPSYSVAKSVVSILTGQLVAEGKLKLSDTFVQYFPEYKTGTDYDYITLAQLLNMSSGVAVADNYPDGPAGWGNPIAQMYATTDLSNFILNHRDLYWSPGMEFEYRSIDTLMVGMMLERVSGKSLATLTKERIWTPIGMESDATWNVDHLGGTTKAFCCLNATARDYAKLGQATLTSFIQLGNSFIENPWRLQMQKSVTQFDHGWGYGNFIWHPYPDSTMFLGLYGQFVYIQPANGVVIVKLSNNKSGSYEAATVQVFRQIADSFAR